MGITGFLPLLKPVTKDTHVRDLKGLTVGIDTYCWLHKGVYSCSSELCQGIPTDKFIKFCVERVHLLLSHGVRPYLVFDGGYLPAKADKEVERKTKREANMQRARQLLREGNISGAHQFFSKAADVTPFMAHQLIQVVKRIPGVRYVVAPYEADAQLGFLARNGHVDAVITEDSDVLLFGCTRVLFKLERDGTGQEVNLKDVFSRRNDELDMRGMDEDDLVTVCALSGCDYLPSVPGVGLKKAYRLVKRHKQLSKILKAVKFECTGAFPSGYEDNFLRALFTFRHQRAFDPATRMTVHMTPLPESLPEALVYGDGSLGGGADPLDFLGPHIEAARASAVADGDVDPITGQPFSEMAHAGANHSVGSSGEGRPSVPEEIDLNGSSLEALAKWRGAVTTAGRRRGAASGGITKKLSTHGNNLTKYWGAPVSKKSPSRPASSEDVDSCSTERRFEIMDTTNPETPRRGSGATDAKCKSFRGHVAKEEPSSCVSPSSFYDGVGGNSLPTSDGASKSKGDREPSPPVWSPETNPEAAKSKHFCGSARSGVTVVTPAPAGLRRRTLRPLRTDVASEPSGGGGRRRKALGGDANSWGAEYACPREGAESNNSGSLGGGGLKRRKTLGVGSLAAKEIIRGLAGVASGDWSGGLGRCVGLGRRIKSVGGTPKTSSIGARGDGSESTPDGGDDVVGNLFERFAARSPLSSSSQSNVEPSRSSHVHIASQEESSGASASGTDPENSVLSRRAQEIVVEGKLDEQEHICGDAGVLLADKCCGDKAGTDERRVEVRTSLTSRVDKIVVAGSDRFFKGQRGNNDNGYYGDRKSGGCHVDCSDGGGDLRKEASVKNGQRGDAFVPERNYVAGSAACEEDLFARFVYSPPDR